MSFPGMSDLFSVLGSFFKSNGFWAGGGGRSGRRSLDLGLEVSLDRTGAVVGSEGLA